MRYPAEIDDYNDFAKALGDQTLRPISVRVLRATPEGGDEQTTQELLFGPGRLGITIELRDGRVRVDAINRGEWAKMATLTQEGSKPRCNEQERLTGKKRQQENREDERSESEASKGEQRGPRKTARLSDELEEYLSLHMGGAGGAQVKAGGGGEDDEVNPNGDATACDEVGDEKEEKMKHEKRRHGEDDDSVLEGNEEEGEATGSTEGGESEEGEERVGEASSTSGRERAGKKRKIRDSGRMQRRAKKKKEASDMIRGKAEEEKVGDHRGRLSEEAP